MSVSFDHRDRGTPEASWRAASPWSDAVPLDLDIDRLIVVAAHPDDETLGAGGLLATAAARGIPVSVIVATDGEASHPESACGRDLGSRRRREVVDALREVAPEARLRFLGLPDGGLRESVPALRRALDLELGTMPVGVLLAVPWWGDGHRDHRVLGETAREFAGPGVHVVGYPIWLWHWADPAGLGDLVASEDWRVVPLDASVLTAKAAALARYESQVLPLSDAPGDGPIVHEEMAAHFTRPFELFVDAETRVDGTVGQEHFEDFFRRHDDPWGFETSWYEGRKRAVLLAVLDRPRYRSVLELGCATGVLTAELASRADATLGVDLSEVALERARGRAAGGPVCFARMTLPGEWPEGRFDLIVLSEVAYYWSAEDLVYAVTRLEGSLTEDGVLVACHWRHPIADAPLTGDEVHARLDHRTSWTRTVRHLERDFVLDVYQRGVASEGTPS